MDEPLRAKFDAILKEDAPQSIAPAGPRVVRRPDPPKSFMAPILAVGAVALVIFMFRPHISDMMRKTQPDDEGSDASCMQGNDTVYDDAEEPGYPSVQPPIPTKLLSQQPDDPLFQVS